MWPESSDSNFTWESFQGGINKDLADVLGNFVSRVTKFCRGKFGEEVPAGGAYGEAEAAVSAEIAKRLKAYEANIEAVELRKAAADLRAIWAAGNEYLQAAAPWTKFKDNPEDAAAIVRFALNLIRLYGVLSGPYIPDASKTILAAMNAEDATWPTDLDADLSALPAGHTFTTPEVMFAKITDERRDELEAQFAGDD